MRSLLLTILLGLVVLSCTEKTRFELLDPDRTGITFQNNVTESDSLNVMDFEYIYNGAGVGIMDLNNDGLEDIIFTGNQVSPRVYLNKGNFKFEDITSSFENLNSGQWYSGVTYTDINHDGYKDIYFTCTAYNEASRRTNRFYVCQGIQEDGTLLYKDMADKYGIADQSYTVHAAFFDYDLDGDLDLYLLNNWVNDRLSASYRPKKNDGTAVSNDHLYRNDGDTIFTNVTISAGIINEGFGLGLALGDVNKDGYPDIYISDDYISNDLLYINQQDGTFKNEIDKYLSYQTKSSMGDDMADVNNDGYPDILTLDMFPVTYEKKKQTINGFAYVYYLYDRKYGYEHQYLRNMLHLHNGFVGDSMVPYSEVGQMAGVYQTNWCWSPLFADYDNDGDKDLIVANGYPRDLTDKDWTNFKAEMWNFVASKDYLINKTPVIKEPNIAFENDGVIRFVDKSREWLNAPPSFSYGAAFADLDNDGDLDYVVNNLNDYAFVFKNRTNDHKNDQHHYIRISLTGKAGNIPAFGAKVECWSNGHYQFQEQFLSRGYISSVDPVIHFGLGADNHIDSIKVTWPASGDISLLKDLEPDQLVNIDESNAEPALYDMSEHKHKDYLFNETDSVFAYTHIQRDYIDFYGPQKILFHKFSQIGPVMQLGDLNGDGQKDILVGATDTLPTMAYLRKGAQFIPATLEGLTGEKNCTESSFAIVDVDNDGDMDVIALSGGYVQPEEAYIHYLYRNDQGTFRREELPVPPFPASVVKTCDIDHDGYVDLFIGARVRKDQYPFADDSWILFNHEGSFSKDYALGFNVGMVTDAVWSDYDNDGWKDLLIAREWNSVYILKNLDGEHLHGENIAEIDTLHGFWYSIIAGDFDKDGDDDYIVGNLGDNHRFTVSNQYPLHLYAIDIDMNGTIDPIWSGYWKNNQGEMTEYPVNYLDELVGQSPYFLNKFKDYTAFSYATMDDILDPAIRKRIIYTYHINTTSSYILWNNRGTFSWQKLPRKVQVSPLEKMIVRDLNHDSLPDVILAGNDYSFEVSTGYFDANKGLILLSRDHHPLADLEPPSGSGLLLQGMVGSLLMTEDKKPILIVGFNRAKANTFIMNPLNSK